MATAGGGGLMVADRNENEKNGKPLTARQERMAAALASGMTDAAACRQCRVGVTTLWSWKKRPEFRGRVAELRRDLTDRTLGLLAEASAEAVLTLLQLATTSESEATKLNASDRLLTHAVKVPENSEQREQLARLLEQLDAIDADGRKPR
jgi:hypothetical protein